MTHIDSINEPGTSFGPSQTKTGKSSPADAFQNALSKALETRQSNRPSSTASALTEVPSVKPVTISQSEIVSGKTDKLLDLLEAYSNKLDNPNVTLKNIAPDLEQIHSDAGHLEKDARQLSEKDAYLKEIANQTIVTAQTEYIKFQRGDYLE
jgi:hypothetical protein